MDKTKGIYWREREAPLDKKGRTPWIRKGRVRGEAGLLDKKEGIGEATLDGGGGLLMDKEESEVCVALF